MRAILPNELRLKRAVLLGVLAVAAAPMLSSTVAAQNFSGNGWTPPEGRAYGLTMGGAFVNVAMEDKMMKGMTREEPVAPGTFFFMRGGKLYSAHVEP